MPEVKEISSMFNSISKKYDLLNHLLSFNIDKLWRKKLISQINPTKDIQILDLCTGTADVAIDMAKKIKDANIIGVDVAAEMLEVGVVKTQKLKLDDRISLVEGDALYLPYEDETFDVVTMSFGFRNLENQAAGIREMKRVLKKGGQMLILEFSPEQKGIWGFLYKLHLKIMIPILGRFVSGSSVAYQYLSSSIQDFLTPRQVVNMMIEEDVKVSASISLMGGIAYIYGGTK